MDRDLRERSPRRVARKLVTKMKPIRASSVLYPDRLKEGLDSTEDAALPSGGQAHNMNQSVFSMIAAAGSQANLHAHSDEDSSESDENGDAGHSHLQHSTKDRSSGKPSVGYGGERHTVADKESPFLAPLAAGLPQVRIRSATMADPMSQSSILPPRDNANKDPLGTLQKTVSTTYAEQPSAKTPPEDRASSPKFAEDNQGQTPDAHFLDSGSNQSSLLLRLREIFGFKDTEEVVSQYPCWLLQSVLLQGYLYITRNHVCFYAYLPKKSHTVVKSGHLSKCGRQNPKYKRYWFSLKGDNMSYYGDQSDLYFPRGTIDLRYATSASLVPHNDHKQDTKQFSVTTNQRVYHFKADSSASAKEWVKSLQRVIFRSHNHGDSVKISLPIRNIIDIEENSVIGFADTFRIRIVDNDETYAIDEYYFSFFQFGKDALSILRAMMNEAVSQAVATNPADASTEGAKSTSRNTSRSSESRHRPISRSRQTIRLDTSLARLHEPVKATLSPYSPTASGQVSPRLSLDAARNSMELRRSMDVSRNSLDMTKRQSYRQTSQHGKRSASLGASRFHKAKMRDESPSNGPSPSTASRDESLASGDRITEHDHSDDEHASGSQILQRSVLFQPTNFRHVKQLADLTSDPSRRASLDSPKSTHSPTHNEADTSSNIQNQSPELDAADSRRGRARQSRSSPAINQLVKAAGLAGYLRSHSKKMGSLLATESMGYVGKVSGMWAGEKRHYRRDEGISAGDHADQLDDEEDNTAGDEQHGNRFRAHFGLPDSERLLATYFGFLHRVLPLYGKIYISDRKFCFRSLLPGTRTKLILPLKDIENVDKEKGFRFGYAGLVIVIRAYEELFFEFSQQDNRDDCAVTLLKLLGSLNHLDDSNILTQEDMDEANIAKAEHIMLLQARQEHATQELGESTELADTSTSLDATEPQTILFDDPRSSILNFKPNESLRITCLTIGSRGDVQPYIALCKGLIAEGHLPTIATHAEFRPWIEGHGIAFAPVEGDPAELMRICVENGMFTYSFLKEASSKFRGWIDDLLVSAWLACQNTDLLIESPSAMAGIHIAEALGVPYFRAFTMPWTRTRAYPHAFAVPEHKMGGAYNYITYVMFDNVFWKAIAGQVNRWRNSQLELPATSLDKMQPNKVPFLYNFSPSVVIPPLDYSDWIRVTGYWFLDEASDWQPPEDLSTFITQARSDRKKLVYIGFGSIVVSDPVALTKSVVDSVLKADVRAILSKGWSDRLGNRDASIPEVELPSEILQIKSAPHDWLFQQIDAAAHHGGAGTTGASLRAGIPTIVKPFFGDQFFFGSRIEDLGVGRCLKKLNVSSFSRALWEATHSQRMIVKAKALGERIRQEDGVGTAIQAIYRDLEYARTLTRQRRHLDAEDGLGQVEEESWTFIGDDSDPELIRRIREWDAPWADPGKHHGGQRPYEQSDRKIDLGA